ncbi:MAG: hypothetical protein H8E66_33300 [Planctomycetes bacterium]|nr:hypothetical protein [Planctomycetota bacterium]
MSDSNRDGTRFVDADDLAEAAQLILDELDASQRKDRQQAHVKPQFTVASIFVLTFFVCLGSSAGGGWIAAPVFAGIVGFLAIIVIAWTAIAFPTSSRGRLVWISIALAYLFACVAAVLRMKT